MNNNYNNISDLSNYSSCNLISIENSDNTFHKFIPLELAYLSPTMVSILQHKHFKENKERRIIFHSISSSILEEVVKYLYCEYSIQCKSPKPVKDYNPPTNLAYDLLCFADYLELNNLIDKTAQVFAFNFQNIMTFDLLPEYIIEIVLKYLSIPNLVRAESVIKNERINLCIDKYWNNLFKKPTDNRNILIQHYLENTISNSIQHSKSNQVIVIDLIQLLLPEIIEIHIHNPNISLDVISTFCNNINKLKLLDLSNNNINSHILEMWCINLRKHEVYVNKLNLSSTNMTDKDINVLFSDIKSFLPPITNIKTSPIEYKRKLLKSEQKISNNNNNNNFYSPHSPLTLPKSKLKLKPNFNNKRIITINNKQKSKLDHFIKLDIHNNPLNKVISKSSLFIKSLFTKKIDLIELNISNNINIGNEGSVILQDLLKYTHTLEYLNISNINLGCDGINNIFEGLIYNSTLKSLDISSNIISPKCLLQQPINYLSLENALKTNNSLKELSLSNNICSVQLIQNFMKGIERNTSICILNLSNCHLHNIICSDLALSLYNHSILTSLDISNNLISSKNLCEFIKLINKSPINYLDVSNNSMNSEFISKLSNELCNNTVLTVLNISGSINSDQGGIELIGSYGLSEIKQFNNNYTINLKKFYLNNQNIRDRGCIDLSKWIISSTINELYIRNNGITTRGLMFLIDSISVMYEKLLVKNDNEIIIYIDLSNNPFDDTGLRIIKDIYKLYGEKVKIRIN